LRKLQADALKTNKVWIADMANARARFDSGNLTCPPLSYKITLKLPDLEPDPKHLYLANLDHRFLRDDE
jgi:hypothetical protein